MIKHLYSQCSKSYTEPSTSQIKKLQATPEDFLQS
jgi:hypothetical protein